MSCQTLYMKDTIHVPCYGTFLKKWCTFPLTIETTIPTEYFRPTRDWAEWRLGCSFDEAFGCSSRRLLSGVAFQSFQHWSQCVLGAWSLEHLSNFLFSQHRKNIENSTRGFLLFFLTSYRIQPQSDHLSFYSFLLTSLLTPGVFNFLFSTPRTKALSSSNPLLSKQRLDS